MQYMSVSHGYSTICGIEYGGCVIRPFCIMLLYSYLLHYGLLLHVISQYTYAFSLLFCHFHILVGIFHDRTWLVYSNDGLPQNALGLCEQASWMHTHLVSF